MSDYVQCPGCGKKIPVETADALENGSPACAECARAERERDEE